MQIPDRQDHALVVSTDNLNARFEQALMSVVESAEGQADPVLANVLNRRLLPDTGQNFLQALHDAQLLRAVHIDQVVMLPMPHMQFPLRTVIEMMGGAAPAISADHAVQDPEKYNPHVQNANAMNSEQRLGVARNLIVEAEMLETDARAKRERAYYLDPAARPGPARSSHAPAERTVLAESKAPPPAPAAKKPAARKAAKKS
ncbi:MAG: hypothetical protein EOO77_13860 [Oxalobacteraceae bacterium]|nr:MAG: hypothetical protein EOO77_13860 [Oxalobacteraceae bacterium]